MVLWYCQVFLCEVLCVHFRALCIISFFFKNKNSLNNIDSNIDNICIYIVPFSRDTKHCNQYYYPVGKLSQSFRFT